MNITDLPPGHYVATRLPDGRYATAPWDDPVAPVIRALNAARGVHGEAPDDPERWAVVTAWLDEREPAPAVVLELVQGELWTAAEIGRAA